MNAGGFGRGVQQKVEGLAWAKDNGKLVWAPPSMPNTYFHSLEMDHRTGKVEFAGYNLRVTITPEVK